MTHTDLRKQGGT